MPRPPISPLFPYTTLFRSAAAAIEAAARAYETWRLVPAPRRAEMLFAAAQLLVARKEAFARDMTRERSEEHTSELQSLAYLVCRLLLEKKKNKTKGYK